MAGWCWRVMRWRCGRWGGAGVGGVDMYTERAGACAGKSRGACVLLVDCSIFNRLISGCIFRACFAALRVERQRERATETHTHTLRQ